MNEARLWYGFIYAEPGIPPTVRFKCTAVGEYVKEITEEYVNIVAKAFNLRLVRYGHAAECRYGLALIESFQVTHFGHARSVKVASHFEWRTLVTKGAEYIGWPVDLNQQPQWCLAPYLG